jgi:hypothetical protein
MDFNTLNERFMKARVSELKEAEGDIPASDPEKWTKKVQKDYYRSFKVNPVEITYHIPGKGGWNRKTFKSQEEMQKWLAKLRAEEGDDIEVKYSQA